jgi:uncharacterized protein (TIGR03067 family)
MRNFLGTGLALALLLSGSVSSVRADDARGDAIRGDLAKLQGTWQLLEAETDGRKMPEEQVKQFRVIIQGDRHTVQFGEQVLAKEVRFQIDPTTEPRSVDDLLEDGRMIRGIYELQGDRLRSCVAGVSKDRPTEFTAKPGSGQTLRVFTRVKPEGSGEGQAVTAKDEAIKKERKEMAGTWQSVAYTLDGTKTPEEELKKVTLLIDGDGVATLRSDGKTVLASTLQLDPTKTPKTLDVAYPEGDLKGKTAPGIYKIEGDTLTICRVAPGKDRPAEFSSPAGSGLTLMVYKRQ